MKKLIAVALLGLIVVSSIYLFEIYNELKVLKELSPDQGQYNLIVFIEDPYSNESIQKFEVSSKQNPQIINRVKAYVMGFELEKKIAAALGIKNFPMYVLVDRRGIVMQTQNPSELENYLEAKK